MAQVTLEREDMSAWRFNDRVGHVYVVKSRPFYRSRAATRVHRVRMATMHYFGGEYSHTSFKAWCGHVGFSSKRRRHNSLLLLDDQGDLPICATCEGRAVGAGALGEREIQGRAVIYTPRNIIVGTTPFPVCMALPFIPFLEIAP